jgi:hypothetical protein
MHDQPTRETQLSMSLPPRDTNDILREKIRELELQIIASEAKGDLVRSEGLRRERKRVVGVLNGGKPNA